MRSEPVSFRTKVGFVCGLVALLVIAAAGGCGTWQPPNQRNRVPTVQAQVDQARRAAEDAKAAAAEAQQTQKNIQAAIDQLNSQGRNSDGSGREDRPQQTGAGVIVDFGSLQIPADQNYVVSDDSYLGFTFNQRDGFTKRFFPVCPGQSIQAYKPVVIMCHWRHDQSSAAGKRGCYVIDGQQASQ